MQSPLQDEFMEIMNCKDKYVRKGMIARIMEESDLTFLFKICVQEGGDRY